MGNAAMGRVDTLQQMAERWANLQGELRTAEDELRRARDKVERIQAQQSTLSEALNKRVGPNISIRVFKVSPDEALIVEQGKAVRLVRFDSSGQ